MGKISTRSWIPSDCVVSLAGVVLACMGSVALGEAAHGGESDTVSEPPSSRPHAAADVVVYSATPSGIAAAVMAARTGAEVLLIEPTRHVGGLTTSGVNTAETEHMLAWTIGGFAREFYQRMGRHYAGQRDPAGAAKPVRPAYEFESGVAERTFLEMLREAGVGVRIGTAVESVSKEGNTIMELKLTDGSKMEGRIFVDASYEGDLMARAGVSWAVGREGRDEFGEDLAGIRFDREPRKARTVDENGDLLPGISGWRKDFTEGQAHRGVMNCNFRLIVTRDATRRVPFPATKHYDPMRYRLLADWLRQADAGERARVGRMIDLYPRRNGKYEMNNMQAAVISLGHFGGQFGWPEADYEKRAEMYEDHLQYTLGLLHFLSHDPVVPEAVRAEMGTLGLHADEFPDNAHLPYQLYVREGRRMRGAYVMRQQDVQVDRRKPDSIGMGSHFMDCHHVQRLAVSPDEFVNEGRIWRKGHAYHIPYRALTPKPGECSNLLVPVAASFTHVAYCTLRVEATWMVTGQAAGVAAAMAAKQDRPVQELEVRRLRETLRDQGQVIDFMPGKQEKCEHLNGPPEF